MSKKQAQYIRKMQAIVDVINKRYSVAIEILNRPVGVNITAAHSYLKR